jgi:hypothetical protein
MRLVKSMAFNESPSQDGQPAWLSPHLMLEMREGDVKAHALMLCNIFLGLNVDAYVCVGTAEKSVFRGTISATFSTVFV